MLREFRFRLRSIEIDILTKRCAQLAQSKYDYALEQNSQHGTPLYLVARLEQLSNQGGLSSPQGLRSRYRETESSHSVQQPGPIDATDDLGPYEFSKRPTR